jgi:flagellar biogenesis protein FliO
MPHKRVFLLVCLLCFGFIPNSYSSNTKINLIKFITIESSEEQEKVRLKFEKPFPETTSQHFDSGLVRITLPYTNYNKTIETKHVNDRFIRIIRLFKEGSSSILEIQFADNEFQAIGKVTSSVDGQFMNVYIDKSTEPVDIPDDRSIFLPQSKSNVQATPIELSNELLQDSNITVNIIKMLLAVAAILIFFYSILWIYNKFFVTRFSFKKGGHAIRMVNAYHISPKQKIVVLDVDDTTYACGVTPSNISLISEITDKSFYSYLSQLKPDYDKGIDFTRLRTQYLESKNAKSNKDSLRPKTPFAAELLSRVKKLKPID